MLTRSQYEELVAIDQGRPENPNKVIQKAIDIDLRNHGLINDIGELTKKGKYELGNCDIYN